MSGYQLALAAVLEPAARLTLAAEHAASYDPAIDGRVAGSTTGTAGGGASAGPDPAAAVGALADAVEMVGRADWDACAQDGGIDVGLARDVLACAVGLLDRVDTAGLSDRALCDHAISVDREVTRGQARVAGLVAAVDRREAYRADGCVTAGSWWRHRTRRDPHRAALFARCARRLERLDGTRSALAAGEITFAHAQVVADASTPRYVGAVVAAETTLVELARRSEPRAVRRACKRIADAVDCRDAAVDGTHDCGVDAGGPDPRRELYLSQTFEGLWDLRGTLDPVTGERLNGLLHALTVPDPAGTPLAECRMPAQRRHDGFDRLVRAAEEHPGLPAVHGAKPHVVLMMDVKWLLGADAVWGPKLASGLGLEFDRAVELLQDATVAPVAMWGPFRPAGVADTQRVLPGWLRRILHAVHGTCRGPGCDRPAAWTQAAHLQAWGDGGPTDIDNTLPLCPAHHRMLDTTGWTCRLDPDSAVCTWTSPDGQTVIRTRPPDP